MADHDKGLRTSPASPGSKSGTPSSTTSSTTGSPTQQATGASTTSAAQGSGTGVSSGSIARGSSSSGTTGSSSSAGGMGAGGTSSSGSNTGGGRISEDAQRYKDEAKHYASDMTERAKTKGKSMLEERKGSAAQQFDSVAHAMRNTADQLQGEGQSQTGHYVGMLAERLEDFGRQLRDKDMDTLIGDAENLGRRSPGTFLAGSVIAGFLFARFLKSSSQRRHGGSEMSSMRGSGRDSMRDNTYGRGEHTRYDTTSARDSQSGLGGTSAGTSGVVATGGGADTAGATRNSLSPSTSPTNPGGNIHGNR